MDCCRLAALADTRPTGPSPTAAFSSSLFPKLGSLAYTSEAIPVLPLLELHSLLLSATSLHALQSLFPRIVSTEFNIPALQPVRANTAEWPLDSVSALYLLIATYVLVL